MLYNSSASFLLSLHYNCIVKLPAVLILTASQLPSWPPSNDLSTNNKVISCRRALTAKSVPKKQNWQTNTKRRYRRFEKWFETFGACTTDLRKWQQQQLRSTTTPLFSLVSLSPPCLIALLLYNDARLLLWRRNDETHFVFTRQKFKSFLSFISPRHDNHRWSTGYISPKCLMTGELAEKRLKWVAGDESVEWAELKHSGLVVTKTR